MAMAKSLNFDEYMKAHASAKGEMHTHTRIGDPEKGIYPGSYQIDTSEWSEFMRRYYQYVFVAGKTAYLTEKQLIENGPILVDIDLRYETSVTKRQHTQDHIVDAVMLYADKIVELLDVTDGAHIDVFVMEKPEVNVLDTKTKDGVHIIICLKMHKALQVLLRKKVMNELKNMWDDLPITNTWDDVLDEGITRGFVNWQMYGSRKPGHQTYTVKNHYQLNMVSGNWEIEEKNNFVVEQNIERMSARFTEHPEFAMKESVETEFEETKLTLNQRQKTADGGAGNRKGKYTLKPSSADGGSKLIISYENIENEEKLDSMLAAVFASMDECTYHIKETHQYVMTLPVAYYGPGSYNKWLRVGWALANTSPNLFLSWVKFSSQSSDFAWDGIKSLHKQWLTFEYNPDGLTHRSIMYWSKNDAGPKYDEVRKETVDFFINKTIKEPTEYDIASVLYHMYKDKFICVSNKNNIWYEYINNRWFEIDSGNTLRSHISKELHQAYMNKTSSGVASLADETQDNKFALKTAEIALYLKKTVWKNNIMREARELFYVKDFMEKLDQNPYLLCFNNCVVDFKEKIHRRGQPDDYISKCTNIDYVPFNSIDMALPFAEISQFMCELFPAKELHDYMWQHLSSCLIGTNENQTFNIYKGGGRNGKSKLTDLMSKGLGSYKATVPITLITQKRNSIGSTSSEIVQLMGVRYAVMQEPTKGDRINEGIMKEITGGDPIQGRALFKDTVTFTPQFKLVVCTNVLFEDLSNDDGTWRRIRICDFMSKFLEKPFEDPEFPQNEYPHQYILDKSIDKKFDTWAPIFISYLVKMAYELQGNVKDCSMVVSSSTKYRNGQDYIAEFAKIKLRVQEGEKVKKGALLEEFKIWYLAMYGRSNNTPKGKDVHDYMEKKYGIYKNGGWNNVMLVFENDE